MPPNTHSKLRGIRGRIAHGNTDTKTLDLASANLQLLQRLVADGIALVCGLHPTSFNVLQPNPIELVVPCIDAKYSPDEDPTKRWGGLLSDTFARYLEGVSASKTCNPQFSESLVFGNQGKHDEAIKTFEKAIALNPPDATAATAWRNKGLALLNLGKYNESIQANDKAIELNPKFVDAWNDKGRALIGLLKYNESIDVFERIIQIDPKFKYAWSNKGLALVNQGKHDEAIKAFEEATRLDPNDSEAWYNKGVALMALGRTSEADVAFAKVKELGYT